MIFEIMQQLSRGGLWFKSYLRKGRESIDRSKWRRSWVKSRGVLLALALLVAVTTLVKWTNTVSAGVNLLTKWGGQGAANGLFNGPFGVAVDSSGNVYVSDTGNNRIQKFNSSGTFITQWGTFGGANGNFNSPIGVAVDGSSNVYVADVNNNRIQKFSSSGSFISRFGTVGSGDGQFHSPYGVAVDLSGNIYVADSSNHRIQKFDSSGSFIATWGTHGGGNGQFDNPRGLTVDHSGNTYVADVGNSRIQKFDSFGNYVTQWGASGSGNGQFQFVAGVVADAWGYVYVTDAGGHNIQKFTSAGAFVTRWGANGTGDGQFNVPFGLAVDSLGNVFVADSNNNRIQKFGCPAPEEYHTLNIGAPGIFNMPQGVAVDSTGNLYVADTDNSRVRKYTPSGTLITEWGSFGSGSGQFSEDFGIAIDSSDNVYVSEIFSPRIQKFTSSGAYISQFPTGGVFSRGIAVDRTGNIYVADEGTNSVRKFNSSGSLVTQWGGGPQTLGIDGLFYTPQGVAVDPWGYVYVTDLGNNRVQKFDSSGNFISKFGSLGTGDGQFWNPRGLGIDAAGNIYVADTLRHRVQKLTNSGTFVIKWGDHGSHDGEFQDPFGITVDQSGNIYVVDTNNVRIQKFSQGAPVARAGPDQTFTCVKTPTQTVTLNATSTTDPTPGDAATLEYEWSEGTTLLGAGSTLSVPFALGTHTITLAVTDDCDHSSTDTVVINVSAYNHATCNTAPEPVDDAPTFNEDSGAQLINVLANDTDYDNDALIITSVTQGAHGSVALAGGGVSLTYTPAADYFGSDSFTYSISDGHGGTATGTVNVTVDAVNDPPSFTKGANQTVDEDSGSQLTGWATNILSGPPNEAGQTLDFIVSNNNNALFSTQPVVAANGSLSYTPAPDANGTATVSVQLHDNGTGLDTSAAQTFTITVNAVNDPPSFTRGADQIISENAGPQTASGWATNISQGPGESGQTPLSFSVNVSSTTGNLSFVTQPSIDATNGTLTYQILNGTNGTANLSVTLSDSGAGALPNSNTSPAQTFSITVSAVNDVPVNTVPAAISIPQDTVYTFTSGAVSVADVDAAETDNVISVALNATNGTMNLSGTTGLIFNNGGNGSAAMTLEGTIPNLNASLNNMTFTPTPGHTGVASIQMVSNDLGKTGTGGPQSDTDTINITVNAAAAMYINEVLFNPPGTDAPNEYIELRSPANTTIPVGTYLVAIEGDAVDNPGDVRTLINLSGLSIGSNGFLVLLQNGNTYTTDAGATVVTSTTTGFGGLPSIFQADGGAAEIEDASVTFMLIQTAVPPTLTDDIDVNDDGATDGFVFAGWNVRDSISAMNGSANARAYGAFSFRNSAGSGTSVGTQASVNFIPSYVGRIGDSTGSTSADWLAGGVLGGAAPNWTLGVATDTEPSSFAGKALNHIGASNFVNVSPVNSFPVATQNVNEDFTLTFNAGNANLISISDPDAGGADVKVTLIATNGTMSLSGTAGLTFTPAEANNDGVNDAQMIFTGTIASINTALDGMTFTPALDYFGAGSIQIVTDDRGNVGVGGARTDTDTVNLNVNPINDPPSFALNGNSAAVNEDSGLQTINGFASSISQGPGESGQTPMTFTLTLAGAPTGNISFASGPAIDATTGILTYTTNPDTNGSATFDVTLSDSGSNAAPNANTSAPQQFTITVNSVNDAPTFLIPSDPPVVNEDAVAQTVNNFATAFQPGPATASDENTQTLVGYTVAQTGTTGNLTFTSGPSIDSAGALTYTPTGDTSGTATFNVVATDNGSGVAPNVNQSAPVSFTITVNGQNDAPLMDNSGTMSLGAINEDVPNASNPGTLVSDVILSAGGDRITDVDAGAVEGIAVIEVNNTNGTWQYSIDNGTNWLPFETPDSLTARLLAADATTRVRFIPNLNFNGTVDPGLTFRAWDLTSGANGNTADTSVTGNTAPFSTATETASITINPVNDNPTTTGIPAVTVNEDPPNTSVDLRLSFNDVEDGNDLAYTVQANTNPSLFSSVSINNTDDNLTLAYTANAFGSAQITIRGIDVGGLFVESTFTVTVNSSNDPPTFTKGADQTTIQNSGPQTVPNWATSMSTGPADEAGQTLTFNVTGNTNAALFSAPPAIDATTGTLTYTGTNNASGNATITITLSDNGGTANGGTDTSASRNFVITITPCLNPATVDNTNDSGAGSVRDAITNVCAGGTINFDPALNGQTITLTSAELVIDKNMTINGPGANLLAVVRSAADWTPQFRIFKNLPGKTVSISGLTISKGSSALDGGGVFNQGTLTLTASSVTGNTTSLQGGGLSNAAGGTMIITGSTISANTGSPGGGGIVNNGTLTLINSTVTGNAGDGLSNTNGANANLTNDTFANNSVRGITSDPGAATNVRNTIVVNTPGAFGDLSGNFVSQGNNLIGKGDSSSGLTDGVNNDKVGTSTSPLNALLAVLGNYGGPTQTHALLPGSPAIEAANNCVTDAAHCGDANIPQLTTDQRGASFNRLINPMVDIGAFESRGFTITTTSGTPQDAVFKTVFGAPLSATVISAFGEPVSGGQVWFTAPGSGAGATFTGGVATLAAVINASGQASATATANATVGGPYNVTATGIGVTGTSNFSLTNIKANQTINFAALANKTFGDPDFTVSATAASGLPVSLAASGNCTVTSLSPGTVHITAAGPCSITASQSGDANYTPAANMPQSFNITKATTSTAVTSTVNPSGLGQSVTLTATVTSGAATPTGAVQFKDNGSNLGGPIALNASGVAQLTTSALTTGPHTITADYSGDANFLTDAATLSGGQVVKAQPSLSINDVSITEGDVGTKVLTFTVTLSTASSLTVTTNYATANGTATAPSDYAAIASTLLTFNPGDTSKQVSVNISGDINFETDEAFFVNLSNPVNATISDNQGLGTIQNDDVQGGFISFSNTSYNVNEDTGIVTVTVVRSNDVTQAVAVDYATDDTGSQTNCSPLNTGLASQRCDYTAMFGTLRFAANETQKTIDIPINLDAYNEGPETFTVKLSNPTGGGVLGVPSTANVTINDSASPAPNAIDDTTTFVRQQYRDFLNRNADAAGLAFWKNNIDKCNDPAQRPAEQTLAQCIEIQRITTTAAFFLSIEFKQTGGTVRDFYVAALDRPLTNNMTNFVEFMRDTQAIQKGVTVGQGNWQQALDVNRTAFMNDFVTRAEFVALYPTTDTPTQYVDKLYLHANVTGTQQERLDAIADFSGAATAADTGARARALLRVTQSGDFQARELNRGFVQMQYFGYLRRNPNDPPDGNFNGFNFWVGKLNQFNGDFLQAEMVKAFLSSSEYRGRFGP